MSGPLEHLKALKQKKSGDIGESFDPDSLVEIHHTIMKAYSCWIPVKEFRELPIPALWNLLELIKRDQDREKKDLEKSRSRR